MLKRWLDKIVEDRSTLLVLFAPLDYFHVFFLKDVNAEPTLVAQYDSTCRITSLSLWTEKGINKNQEPDVKPEVTESSISAPKVVVEKSNHDRPKSLKPLLKRPANKSILVKTSSGPFIAEPVKQRDDKRTRLTFIDTVS